MICRVCPRDFVSDGKSKVKSFGKVVRGLSCLRGLNMSML